MDAFILPVLPHVSSKSLERFAQLLFLINAYVMIVG